MAPPAALSPMALLEDLRRIGVRPGDVVMVHASLRAIGAVEGRADGVVAALDEAVAAEGRGAWMMVLGAADDHAWVHDRPETEREALLVDATPFDPMSTPADPEVGALAEVMRASAGTRVTDHPEGRFAARGHLAADLVSEQPWNDYYGPGCPLERLVANDGKVLRMGADLNTVTLIHYAEYLARVPNKRRISRHRRVVTPSGPEVRRVEALDDSLGIREYPGEDYFADLLSDYLALAQGNTQVGRVGHAASELIDARALLQFAIDWLEREFATD